MWNEPHSRYGWNIDHTSENRNPCDGCMHQSMSYPYCDREPISHITCHMDINTGVMTKFESK